MNQAVAPTHIALHQKSRQLEIHFNDGSEYQLSCEYLRVFSPSAEVRAAKNRGEMILGREQVNIKNIEPMGNYAIRLLFDDGHDTGVYSWSTLKQLGEDYDKNWDDYLKKRGLLEQQTDKEQTVNVLLFMTLAQRLGQNSLTLSLEDGISHVSDVLQRLREQHAEQRELLEEDQLTITVNKQFCNAEQRLYPGDELALAPKS